MICRMSSCLGREESRGAEKGEEEEPNKEDKEEDDDNESEDDFGEEEKGDEEEEEEVQKEEEEEKDLRERFPNMMSVANVKSFCSNGSSYKRNSS